VGPVYLFDLASRQSQFLSVRQATIAGNVANANTPGFRAKDVGAFSEVLDKTQLGMAITNAAHLRAGGSAPGALEAHEIRATGTLPSGGTVNLEQEMIKAGEVSRDFSLNSGIVKSFHRMLMMCVRA
jgi:flagellar basal-body rod protein FlgB